MKINNKIFTKYLPPIVWAFLIFILSAIPGDDYPSAAFDYAQIAHFIEFFILAILVLRAMGIKNKPRTFLERIKSYSNVFIINKEISKKVRGKHIYLTLIICTLYALSDEIHQIFVINRSASLLDWLIDFLAIIIALKFYLSLKQKTSSLSS